MRVQSDSVRFLLDGEVIEVHDVDPIRTVLQFLREDLGRTGTKEGCAEGDCGACTVALAELDRSGERLSLRAVNSCIQFLPTLDGRELITIESLAGDEQLHPVQQAMVDCHGSQCGFCTPGIVMSLFVHYKTSDANDRSTIDDVLAGNLCRCTGYRPIADAAQQMYETDDAEGDWRSQRFRANNPIGEDERQKIGALLALRRDEPMSTKSEHGLFVAPRNSDELAQSLLEHPQATIVAGGTDVGLWVTKQHRDLSTVVYTGNVEDMRTIDVNDSVIDVGAAATLSDFLSVVSDRLPRLRDLFRRFASPPIRNAGTLGGNVANGSPIGDSMPALLALDTTLCLRKGSERREIALDTFYLDYMQNALQAGEFVERIRIPLPGDDVLASYKLSKRFDQDISAVCAAFRLQLDSDTVTTARIAFGGMAAIPKRAAAAEAALTGNRWTQSAVDAAIAALHDDFQPLTDMRSTAGYRMRGAQNLLQRFYLETTAEIATDVYNYGRDDA